MKLKQILLASALLLAANAGAQAADKFAVVMGNIPSANQFWALVEKGALAKGKEGRDRRREIADRDLRREVERDFKQRLG